MYSKKKTKSMDLTSRVAALTTRFATIEKGIATLSASMSASTQAASKPKAVDPPQTLDPYYEDTPEVATLRAMCRTLPLFSAIFKWVPSYYYDRPLPWRRDALQAPSFKHLCKSILLENTHCEFNDCSRRENSRYYLIVFQYVEKFDSDKLMKFVRDLNPGVGKKKFNFRLADPEVSAQLTGFGYNAVAPFGGAVDIPIVLSDKIIQLAPHYFWMGGGHVDCKLRVDVDEFCAVLQPLIADITNPLSEEELHPLMTEGSAS
jgi:prolyl-tRNA editing enzyme YbaK/EbsC (Cys-tRNA(Pro) deacylase)